MSNLIKFVSNKKAILIIDILSYCLFAFMIVITIICYITNKSRFWSCFWLTISIGCLTFSPLTKKNRKKKKI